MRTFRGERTWTKAKENAKAVSDESGAFSSARPRYADANGKIHREKVGPKGLARKVYEKRKTEIREGRYFPAQVRRREVPVEEAINYHLEQVKVRARDVVNPVRYARLWIEALNGKTVREVSPADIERYIKRRLGEVAPPTVNRELAFLKRVFNVAMRNGDTESNPVTQVKMFKENPPRTRFLTEDEELRLYSALPTEDWRPRNIVGLAVHTGLRRGELFSMKWENVDLFNRVITIPRSKSGDARQVPMSKAVLKMMQELPSRMRSEWVFPNDAGTGPLDAHNFENRIFIRAIKKAGIENFRFHDLRHTFASRLAMKGVSLQTIQKLLGHKTFNMTLRYAHLSERHLQDAVENLGEWTGTKTDTVAAEARKIVENIGESSQEYATSDPRVGGSNPFGRANTK